MADCQSGSPLSPAASGTSPELRLEIDWLDKLQVMLQVMAYALAVAAIEVAFLPERPYHIAATYSLCIALLAWFIIDMGRHLFRSARETGWPEGYAGMAIVVCGMVVGFLVGNQLAVWICTALGWYSEIAPLDPATELRTSILITVIATSGGSFFFYVVKRGDYLERKMVESRRQADQARLRLLESQLEPHMLFNTLANLRALIASDPARATAMLDRVIAYLRATLSASRVMRHPLQAEFGRLRDYLELMAVRLGDRLRYTLELPDALAETEVPALILQPLVENALRHAIEPHPEGGEVRVVARLAGGSLLLEVWDSGADGAAPATTSTGFGLEQVRARLAHEYGPLAGLSLDLTPHGTTARLVLPADPIPAP